MKLMNDAGAAHALVLGDVVSRSPQQRRRGAFRGLAFA